jgi:hypothetical protein
MYEVKGVRDRAATCVDSVRDYAAEAFKGSLQKGNTQGDSGALNKTRIMDQVRLKRHMRLLKGLYTRGGLSLKLGTKGETVNKAKYSTGSRKEA